MMGFGAIMQGRGMMTSEAMTRGDMIPPASGDLEGRQPRSQALPRLRRVPRPKPS